MLGDEAAVLEAAQKTDINSSQIDRVLHAARTWRHRLQSEAEQTSAIGVLVDRVELKSDGIRVSIKLPIAGAEKSRAQLPDQVAIARSFPMQLKRRGVELRLIVGDHNRSAAIVDLSLLKAVAHPTHRASALMVLAENRSEPRVAGNIRTCASLAILEVPAWTLCSPKAASPICQALGFD